MEKFRNLAGATVLATTLLFGSAVTVMADTATSGECGKNAKWRYEASTDTLIIEGKGKICSGDWWELDIKNVKIKDGITVIDDYTFNYMNSLTNVDIPDSVTKIGDAAFSNTSIKEFTMEKHVKKIGDDLFRGCKKLKKVNWKASSIPYGTFKNCRRLKVVKTTPALKQIGSYAFYNTGFETFKMRNSVEDVGSHAFAACKKLKNLSFSKRVKKIPSNVVKKSHNLENVVVRENTHTIDSSAFAKSTIKNLVLPSTIKTIGNKAFHNTKGLKEITLPEGVKEIGEKTFYKCSDLENVILPSSINLIGEYAFANCSKLQKVEIPNGVSVIEYKAFENSGCTEVIIHESIKSIEYWAFNNCNNLQKITISRAVDNISYNAFASCDRLTEINVDSDNQYYTSVDGCLLSKDMTKLLVVPAGKTGVYEIPESVTVIEPQAFYECFKITEFATTNNKNFKVVDGILYDGNVTKLISCPISKTGTVTIPSTVTKIGESAFQYSKASQINIPESVVEIGYCAFEYCNNLTSITIPGSVVKVSHASFWECDRLQRVEIKYGTKKIQRNAFYGCDSLKKIVIPASVYFIAESSFNNTSEVSIYCKKSSYAMAYATKWYIDYKII